MDKEPLNIFQRAGVFIILIIIIAAIWHSCFPITRAAWDYRFEIVTSESVGQRKWAYVISDTQTGHEYLIVESTHGIGVTVMPDVEESKNS